MPKIFQYLAYLIRFYTNDHLPIHVHVQLQDRETKVEFHISGDSVTLVFKKIKGKAPLTEAEANEVAVFLKAYIKTHFHAFKIDSFFSSLNIPVSKVWLHIKNLYFSIYKFKAEFKIFQWTTSVTAKYMIVLF